MKMKKTLLAAGVSLLSLGALVGCGGGGDDANTLKIVVLNAGYGETWIKE